MNELFYILLASFLVSAISLSGGLLVLVSPAFTQRRLHSMVGFAAGVMLSAAFLDILPEAIGLSTDPKQVLSFTFIGIILFFFMERFLVWFHHHDETHNVKPTTLLILWGDCLHNFIDGVAIAAAFMNGPVIGFATTLAITAHEIPQEIADFSVLIHGGMKKSKALMLNLLSALSALIGALSGFYFLEKIDGFLPFALAFTAGMFIYIACSDLIPELHEDFSKRRKWLHSLPFIAGILVLSVVIKLFGEA